MLTHLGCECCYTTPGSRSRRPFRSLGYIGSSSKTGCENIGCSNHGKGPRTLRVPGRLVVPSPCQYRLETRFLPRFPRTVPARKLSRENSTRLGNKHAERSGNTKQGFSQQMPPGRVAPSSQDSPSDQELNPAGHLRADIPREQTRTPSPFDHGFVLPTSRELQLRATMWVGYVSSR